MSGHSKWSTIKHQKAVADKRRGQAFSKLGKAISIAARGGADPEKNFKLRLTVDKAKEANMPKSNIERAILRGSGGAGGAVLEEIVYEGYGPAQIAVMVEVVTDNRNRTVSDLKNLFEKSGGSMGGPGSVAYLFEKAGLLMVKNPADPEEAILSIMDLGVESIEEENGSIEIYVQPDQLEAVTEKVKAMGLVIEAKDLSMKPKSLVEIKDERKKEKILKFMEALDSHDDVQKVFANFDFAD